MMRVFSVCLLLMMSSAVLAQSPPAGNEVFKRFRLYSGNLHIDIPASLRVDREYTHYWDSCTGGGYTIAFSDDCGTKSGVTIQVNVHDWVAHPDYIYDHYHPGRQCMKNAQLLEDTSFVIGDRFYKIIATQATPDNKYRKRNGEHANNYYLAYYILADGHMLELRYAYWGKRGAEVKKWKDISYDVVNSIRWQTAAEVTAKN